MLDKNELQDLLVKLKLGTLSVENAIEEIEKNFYINEENDNLTLWQKLSCPFEEVIECYNKPAIVVEETANNLIKRNTSFIMIGIDDDIFMELPHKIKKCRFHYASGIMSYIPNKGKEKLKTDDVFIITKKDGNIRLLNEIADLLNLTEIGYNILTIPKYKAVPVSVIKNKISNSKVILVIDDKNDVLSLISNITNKIIISLKGNNNENIDVNGVLSVKNNSSLSAFTAILRCIR